MIPIPRQHPITLLNRFETDEQPAEVNQMKQWPHNYSTVQEWEAKRTVELSRIYSPYVRVTDAYADLVCEIVDVIGKKKPKSVQDVVVRDLLGDIFDALYEARR